MSIISQLAAQHLSKIEDLPSQSSQEILKLIQQVENKDSTYPDEEILNAFKKLQQQPISLASKKLIDEFFQQAAMTHNALTWRLDRDVSGYIFGYLNQKDIPSIRRTCHFFNAALTQRIADILPSLKPSTHSLSTENSENCEIFEAFLALDKEYITCSGNIIKFWDRNFEMTKSLAEHTSKVSALIDFSDNLIASGGSDKTIKLWDKKTGDCIKTLNEPNGNTIDKLLNISSQYFVSMSNNSNDVSIWDKTSLACTKALSFPSIVSTLVNLSPEHWATLSNDKIIKIWNKHLNLVNTLVGHSANVSAILDFTDSEYVTGDNKGILKVWDKKTSSCINTITGHSESVFKIIHLPNGYYASAASDITIKIWNKKHECVETLQGVNLEYGLIHFSLLPNRQFLVCNYLGCAQKLPFKHLNSQDNQEAVVSTPKSVYGK